jgi:hypothetical protein
MVGAWRAGSAAADGGGYKYQNDAATGSSFAWVPDITETGNYEVSAGYLQGADRATNTPYSVVHGSGTTAYAVNQTLGTGNVVKALGTHPFTAGGAYPVTMGTSRARWPPRTRMMTRTQPAARWSVFRGRRQATG